MNNPLTQKWDKNRSPVHWYIAIILLRLEFSDEDADNLNRQCLAWENEILIKANTPEEAYMKAIAQGKLEEAGEVADAQGRKGQWKFEGLISLLPIYEQLEDGAGISWKEHKRKTIKTIKSWVKQKAELEVFQDN